MAYYLSGSSCLFSCPAGEYGRVLDLQCLTCATGCSVCFAGDVNSCTGCKQDIVGGTPTDFFLVYQTTQCSTTCPSNQYSNATSHSCLLCDSNCLTCSGTSKNCLTCGFSSAAVANLYLHGGACLLNCPDGFYPNTLNNQCTACATGC